jgi:cystathionine beta-lyase/cystathionine gamma-synthase
MVWTVLASADNRARISIGIKEPDDLIADFKQAWNSI